MKRFLSLAILAFLSVSAVAFADDNDRRSALVAGIVRGADLQLARQGTYLNGDTPTAAACSCSRSHTARTCRSVVFR